jgi:abortive infection bacteriophage resistance protein
MIPFSKPSISIKEQIELLKSRGLDIQHPERAERYLEVISYFRLSAYMRPFQNPSDQNHDFKKGIKFQQIVALHAFDRELRLMLMDAVERVEVAVRSMINVVMGEKYQCEQEPYSGSHWYLNSERFNSQYNHQKLIETLQKKQHQEKRALQHEEQKIDQSLHAESKKKALKDLKQRENYYRYYSNNYSEPVLPPSWTVIEELSLGELSHLFKGLKRDADRKAIAKRFNVPQDKLVSWLHTLTFVRNCCAHHARLWNRELPISPKLMRDTEWKLPEVLPNSHIQPAKRLYPVLLLITHLMKQVSPDSCWVQNFLTLLEKYPEVPLNNMGFPMNWQQHPFFQQGVRL